MPALLDRVRELVARLAALPTEQREVELLRACGADRDLAYAVQSRLRAHELANDDLVTETAGPGTLDLGAGAQRRDAAPDRSLSSVA
jgi:hypothetical protein